MPGPPPQFPPSPFVPGLPAQFPPSSFVPGLPAQFPQSQFVHGPPPMMHAPQQPAHLVQQMPANQGMAPERDVTATMAHQMPVTQVVQQMPVTQHVSATMAQQQMQVPRDKSPADFIQMPVQGPIGLDAALAKQHLPPNFLEMKWDDQLGVLQSINPSLATWVSNMIEDKRWFPGFRRCTKEPATVDPHRGYVNQGVCVVCNPDVPRWQKHATAEGKPEGRWQMKAGGNPEGRWQSSSSSGYKRKEQPGWSQQAWKKHQPPHDAHADADTGTQAAASDVVVVDADAVVKAAASDVVVVDKGTDGQPSEAIA